MHIHKFEKLWLILGTVTLAVFLSIVGVQAFAEGKQPPSCLTTIDPDKVLQTAPFTEPGLKQVGANEYELTIVTSAFAFSPANIKIPAGATVHINAATTDVIHGLEIAGTNVNMMVEPGYVSSYTYTFKEGGTFLLLCNEYCGVGHHVMNGRVEVANHVD